MGFSGQSILMKLGKFIFSIDTAAFNEMSISSEYSWVEMERLGNDSIHQWTGPKVPKIKLSGVIFTHYIRGPIQYLAHPDEAYFNRKQYERGFELVPLGPPVPNSPEDEKMGPFDVREREGPPPPQIGSQAFRLSASNDIQGYGITSQAIGAEYPTVLRAMARQGKPLPLIDGRGKFYGHWCIESIEETDSVFLFDGTPKKQEFDITLVKYGSDYKDTKPVNGAASKAGNSNKSTSPWDNISVSSDASPGIGINSLSVPSSSAVFETVEQHSTDFGFGTTRDVILPSPYGGSIPKTNTGTILGDTSLKNDLLDDLIDSYNSDGTVLGRPSVINDIRFEEGKI